MMKKKVAACISSDSGISIHVVQYERSSTYSVIETFTSELCGLLFQAHRIDLEARMTGALSQMEDDDDDKFDIKHKAPQHRQFLNNEVGTERQTEISWIFCFINLFLWVGGRGC